jgi:hypothetical protein
LLFNPNPGGIGQKSPTFSPSQIVMFFVKQSVKLKIGNASQNVSWLFLVSGIFLYLILFSV